jgi:hypothetical protein
MESGTKELMIVLGAMAVLFIIAIIAVFIFIRQWRREHK